MSFWQQSAHLEEFSKLFLSFCWQRVSSFDFVVLSVFCCLSFHIQPNAFHLLVQLCQALCFVLFNVSHDVTDHNWFHILVPSFSGLGKCVRLMTFCSCLSSACFLFFSNWKSSHLVHCWEEKTLALTHALSTLAMSQSLS